MCERVEASEIYAVFSDEGTGKFCVKRDLNSQQLRLLRAIWHHLLEEGLIEDLFNGAGPREDQLQRCHELWAEFSCVRLQPLKLLLTRPEQIKAEH